MHVTDVHVDRFGVWRDLHLDHLGEGVTIVLGANEAGKTTLMQFVRSVLFGFCEPSRRRYLEPHTGKRAGGTMDVDVGGRRLRIERYVEAGREVRLDERVRVEDLDTGGPLEGGLSALLGGMDAATFQNVFTCGLPEIQHLGTLDDTEAADLLYKLSTGLDRVSLVDVSRQLSSAQRHLFDPATGAGQIPDLLAKRALFEREYNEATAVEREWIAQHRETAEIDETLRQLRSEVADRVAHRETLDAACQLRDLWTQRRDRQEQLEAFGPVRAVPAETMKELDRLRLAIDQLDQQVLKLKADRQRLRQQAASQPLNRRLWPMVHQIEAIGEHAPWIASLQSQVERYDEELGELQSEAAAAGPGVLPAATNEATVISELSRRTMAALRPTARLIREQTQRLKQADEECESARRELETHTARLDTALVEHGQEQLAPGVEGAAERVNQLRRRVYLDQRLEETSRQRQRLLSEHRTLMQHQVLAPTTLAWLGIPFIVGVMMILGGLVWSNVGWLGWPIALLGFACWSLALIAKLLLERSAARELSRCDKQMELLHTQIKQAKAERDSLDHLLSPDGGPWPLQLELAEKRLSVLEELLPVEADGQAARQRLQAAQQRLDAAAEDLENAETAWRQALRQLSLPDSLSPADVKQLAEGNERAMELRHRIQKTTQERDLRQSELSAQVARIEHLMQLTAIQPIGENPLHWLQQLTNVVAEQRSYYESWKQWKREDRQLVKAGRRAVAQRRRLRSQCTVLMAGANVHTEEELRSLITRHQQFLGLKADVEKVRNEFVMAAERVNVRAETMDRLLSETTEDELEQQRRSASERIDELQFHVAELHERRGALVHQIRQAADDRHLHRLRFRIACTAEQLRQSIDRWSVLATTGQCLQDVHRLFETERQPQTLKTASDHFKTMTAGRYSRVWTPLSENVLRVNRSTGQTMDIDTLSCGTREMLLLCLRLALVADYSRRGVTLPLLLDDLLVNLDATGAQAAADELLQFARAGHQVILFTCHEHIAQLFSPAYVDMRYLSAPGTESRIASQTQAPVPADISLSSADDEAAYECDYEWEEDETSFPEAEEVDEDAEEVDEDVEEADEEVEEADEDVAEALEETLDDETGEEADEEWEAEEEEEEDDDLPYEDEDDLEEDEGDEEYLSENDDGLLAESLDADYEWEDAEPDQSVSELETDEEDDQDELLGDHLTGDGGLMAEQEENDAATDSAPDDQMPERLSPEDPKEAPPRRFTWESPEQWWDDPRGDAAA